MNDIDESVGQMINHDCGENLPASVAHNLLHLDVIGEGPDLVLLHGWGLNSACWQGIIPLLSAHYRLHLIDLPGCGFSYNQYTDSQSLAQITAALAAVAPAHAVWLGWSLGGLCATHFALAYPHRVSRLITVASSPKFVADIDSDTGNKQWSGIKPQVLTLFQSQLQLDLTLTIQRFLAIQALGCPSAKADIKRLKSLLLARPQPHPQALANGLMLLASVDLRTQLPQLQMPLFRCYGRFDSLVPLATVAWLNNYLGDSRHYIFPASSHAPFISEPNNFVNKLQEFLRD